MYLHHFLPFSKRFSLCSAGTWAPWALRWCATTSPVWWTSNASCAASIPKWCRPSVPGWRTGSPSASTSSATTAGTATPRQGTTTCSDGCCYAVSGGKHFRVTITWALGSYKTKSEAWVFTSNPSCSLWILPAVVSLSESPDPFSAPTQMLYSWPLTPCKTG